MKRSDRQIKPWCAKKRAVKDVAWATRGPGREGGREPGGSPWLLFVRALLPHRNSDVAACTAAAKIELDALDARDMGNIVTHKLRD